MQRGRRESRVLEVIAVRLERTDDPDDAVHARAACLLALQRFVAFDHLGQDHVQHFIGRGVELAVLDDPRDLRVDLAT